MTVHDDLAAVRRHIDREWFASPRDTYPVDMSANRAALSRVEAEIARLERERDKAWFEERRGIDAAGNVTVSVWCRRCGVTHQSPVHCPARNGAEVEALLEAAKAVVRNGARMPPTDPPIVPDEISDLAAAVRRVETGQ